LLVLSHSATGAGLVLSHSATGGSGLVLLQISIVG